MRKMPAATPEQAARPDGDRRTAKAWSNVLRCERLGGPGQGAGVPGCWRIASIVNDAASPSPALFHHFNPQRRSPRQLAVALLYADVVIVRALARFRIGPGSLV